MIRPPYLAALFIESVGVHRLISPMPTCIGADQRHATRLQFARSTSKRRGGNNVVTNVIGFRRGQCDPAT
jgi:hypothetical protein